MNIQYHTSKTHSIAFTSEIIRYYRSAVSVLADWFAEKTKQCSAFCTRRGFFQFTRMPFGLTNAPATCCRLMNEILQDLLHRICICYLDDIIAYAATPEELIDRLDKVFTRLREKGLKAKPSKYMLFKSPIEFLGHLVSADGTKPQPNKIKDIQE